MFRLFLCPCPKRLQAEFAIAVMSKEVGYGHNICLEGCTVRI